MERIPKPGEFYRHFKDKLYQVLAVAKHTETGEQMVVYQALYGDYGYYVRPLSMFVSEVDHEKYPEAEQKYRFQQVVFSREKEAREKENDWEPEPGEEEEAISPLIRRFVEAEGFTRRMEILAAMRGKVKQEELDVLCEYLDLPRGSGDIGQQLTDIEKNLKMQQKFDGNRLR
ncbi:MAG: DUF1653 domain-containing protein [Hungatella sp.]|jgi:hypothetical protein|nr:DUF1653 domain-containing protein [Hungatella sp.]